MDKHKIYVNLNIIQWNARSIKKKTKAFENLLLKEKIHTAALSETWLHTSTEFNIKNYNVFRIDRESEWGGVAILTHKSIQAQAYDVISCNPGIEIVCVKILNCDCVEYVLSLYCPQDTTTTQNDWDQILSLFNSKTLILGDFNGHHCSWSYKTDRRGTQIFDAIFDNHFAYLNTDEHTRLQMVEGSLRLSSPDLSLVSLDISSKFFWSVTNETLGSDHRVIKLTTQLELDRNLLSKRNFKKANWAAYTSYLEEEFKTFQISHDLQEAYDRFIEYLNKAAKLHIPLIKINLNPETKFLPKPYWNSELSKSVAVRRLALGKLRRNPTPDNLTNLQDSIRESLKLLREVSSVSWCDFCSSLDQSSTVGEIWQKMRWMKGQRALKKCIDNKLADKLLNSLTPDFTCPPTPNLASQNQHLECEITVNEMNKSGKSR